MTDQNCSLIFGSRDWGSGVNTAYSLWQWGPPWRLVVHPPLPNHMKIFSQEQDSLGLEIILELAFLLGLDHASPEVRERVRFSHLPSQGEAAREGDTACGSQDSNTACGPFARCQALNNFLSPLTVLKQVKALSLPSSLAWWPPFPRSSLDRSFFTSLLEKPGAPRPFTLG